MYREGTLLARGDVDVNLKDDGGRTSLSHAAGRRHEAVVELLLAQGDVEADSKDKYGTDAAIACGEARARGHGEATASQKKEENMHFSGLRLLHCLQRLGSEYMTGMQSTHSSRGTCFTGLRL